MKTLENYSLKPFQWRGHLGWQKVQTPEVLPELVLPEGRLKNGGASGQEVADLEKKKNHFTLKNPVIPWSMLPLCRVVQPQNTWWVCPRRAKPNIVHYRGEGVMAKRATSKLNVCC